MADYYQTGNAVTTTQDIIDTLLAFLIAVAPGAAWVEDITYTSVANPGELYLATSSATTFYVYLSEETIDTVAVLQCWWDDGAGYGGGAGPTGHFGVRNAAFYMDAHYDYVLHIFADEERCIAVLRGTLKNGVVPDEDDVAITYQTLYFGGYTSHSAAIDDPYPVVVAGNMGILVGWERVDSDVYEAGFFPEAIVKKVGPNDEVFAHQRPEGWDVLYDARFRPPRNSRGSEVFAFQQDLHVYALGSEESLSLTGMHLTVTEVGLEQNVAIGGADYYSIPSICKVNPEATGSYGPVYLIPKGTVVP